MNYVAGLLVTAVLLVFWGAVVVYDRGYQDGFRRGTGKDRRWWS